MWIAACVYHQRYTKCCLEKNVVIERPSINFVGWEIRASLSTWSYGRNYVPITPYSVLFHINTTLSYSFHQFKFTSVARTSSFSFYYLNFTAISKRDKFLLPLMVFLLFIQRLSICFIDAFELWWLPKFRYRYYVLMFEKLWVFKIDIDFFEYFIFHS